MKGKLGTSQKLEYLSLLENTVTDVGKKVLAYKGEVKDTKHVRGHEESSIDLNAYSWMLGALHENLGKLPEKFKGEYLFELRELQDIGIEDGDSHLILRIDEIDGTTNTKRRIASCFDYDPTACVSIALCEDESLDSILIGAVYDMLYKNVFSAVRADEGYLSFCDRKRMEPKDFSKKKGDSSTRMMVVGYSNKERIKKAGIEKAILDSDPTPNKKDYRVYDGSRSTTFDIINIIRNQYDAYVDPRALWKESGAMLYPYDAAGIIPVALGCGLEVTDIFGESMGKYKGKNEPMTLIVARKGLGEKIVKAIEPIARTKD